jgi:VCBS repeat-containing protein
VNFAVNPDTATAIEAGGVNNGTAGTNPSGNVLNNDQGSGNSVSGVQAGTVSSATGGVGVEVAGSFGRITIKNVGEYTYTVNNSHASVQALRTTANTLTDVFTYTASSTSGATASTQIKVTIQGANDTPRITSNGGGTTASLSVNENSTAVTTVVGSDVDAGTTLTYSISGNDASKFSITSAGVLSFLTAPDFEAPTDVGANNVYDVIVHVSDGTLSTTQTIAVSIINLPDFAVRDTATAVEAGGVNNGTAGTNPTGNVSSNDIGTGNTIVGVQAGTLTSATGNVGVAVAGSFGTINIQSTGNYTYTVNNSNASVQALRTNTNTLTDVFTYTTRNNESVT